MKENIRLSKKDVLWNYIGTIFNLGTGLITLPLILKFLSPAEIGINYLFLSVSSLVGLIDFGFTPQFSRNITYVFSGASKLKKEGLGEDYQKTTFSFKLLKQVLETAKYVYRRMSLIALAIMVSLGTIYIYHVTEGFTKADNILSCWCIFCVSVYFNIYFLYYNTLLIGRGLIKESKQASIVSKIFYMVLMYSMLFCGCGLFSIVLANLLSPFVMRFLSYKAFYTKDVVEGLNKVSVEMSEIKEAFQILWYNAKKMGVIGIMSSSLSYLATFIIGLFVKVEEVASYGLMMQIMGIIITMSGILFGSAYPKMCNYYLQGRKTEMKELFSFSMITFCFIYLLGSVALINFPYVITQIGSDMKLPSTSIMVLMCIFTWFEKNQGYFSNLILIENKVPFFKASLITGISNITLMFILLYSGMGILGVVIAQGIPTLCYSAWKWPMLASKIYDITVTDMFIYTCSFITKKIKKK